MTQGPRTDSQLHYQTKVTGFVDSSLTFFVVDKRSNGLEAEITWHELANLLEQPCETPLSAHFRGQLECVNDGLLLFVDLLLGAYLLDLHREVRAEDLKDLFVGLVEPDVLVLSLDDA